MLYVGELEQKYLDLWTQTLVLFLSVILAGMLLVFIVFFLIVRNIVEPIHKLAYATTRLVEGDLTYRVNGAHRSSTKVRTRLKTLRVLSMRWRNNCSASAKKSKKIIAPSAN